jgi:hypothetical protein
MAATPSPDSLPGLAILEQTPIIIEKIIRDASDDEMQWKPSAERWSISEVLAHLADVETVGFRDRIQKMLDEKNPRLEAYDQDAAYASGKYSGSKPRENLKKFCHERDRSLSWLRYLPAGAVSRTGQHTEAGAVTIGQFLNEWACHDLGHIRQIAELYRAHAFYPHIGAFQRYYNLKP